MSCVKFSHDFNATNMPQWTLKTTALEIAFLRTLMFKFSGGGRGIFLTLQMTTSLLPHSKLCSVVPEEQKRTDGNGRVVGWMNGRMDIEINRSTNSMNNGRTIINGWMNRCTVYMHGRTDGRADGWMDRRMDRQMDRQMDGWGWVLKISPTYQLH